jgi:hypothetical protein
LSSTPPVFCDLPSSQLPAPAPSQQPAAQPVAVADQGPQRETPVHGAAWGCMPHGAAWMGLLAWGRMGPHAPGRMGPGMGGNVFGLAKK